MPSPRRPIHTRYPEFEWLKNYALRNPQFLLAIGLFLIGWVATKDQASTFAGALFGAGATLIGTWISDVHTRQAAAEQHAKLREEARRYFVPELYRTIDRALYIHGRAIANFLCESTENGVETNDLQKDFLPYWPVLYPNSPHFRDLSGEEANALVAFYDSLNTMAEFVKDWWQREGQLKMNIFNLLMHQSEESLNLAKVCIDKFNLESFCPPPYASWGTLTSRIDQSLTSAAAVRKGHQTRWEAKSAAKPPAPPRPPSRRATK